jgi:hypothetical protein
MDHAPNPNRRRFLAVGGATVVGGAVLAACGPSGNDTVAHTGALPSTSSTAVPPQAPPTTEGASDKTNDPVLLQTTTSIELLIVNFYDQALSQGWVQSSGAVDGCKLFRDHHATHAATLQAASTKVGVKPYDQANASLQKTLVDPTVHLYTTAGHPTTETDWLQLAKTLESTAASTYVVAASTFAPLELRQLAMSIGGISARHITVLFSLINPDPTTWIVEAFQSTTDAVGSDALIGAKAG